MDKNVVAKAREAGSADAVPTFPDGENTSTPQSIPQEDPEQPGQLLTECCKRRIDPTDRYCPACGWECPVVIEEDPEQRADHQPALAFARKVLSGYLGGGENEIGDKDGGTLEEWAEECGLLERVTIAERCGEDCSCAEYYGYDGFPVQCLRPTKALSPVAGGESGVDAGRLSPAAENKSQTLQPAGGAEHREK